MYVADSRATRAGSAERADRPGHCPGPAARRRGRPHGAGPRHGQPDHRRVVRDGHGGPAALPGRGTRPLPARLRPPGRRLQRLLGAGAAGRRPLRGPGRRRATSRSPVIGYGLSALCKPLLLLAHTLTPDRPGPGGRPHRQGPAHRAARRADLPVIAPETRGRAFGVHRAMDTTGALLGPLAAFLILRATVGRLRRGVHGELLRRGTRRAGAGPVRAGRPARTAARRRRDRPRRPHPRPPPHLRAALALLRPPRGSARICGLRRCCSASPPSATRSSTCCSSAASACPTAGSRCCRWARRPPSCCSPCRWAGSRTGSAAGGCSSPATPRCSPRTACCSSLLARHGARRTSVLVLHGCLLRGHGRRADGGGRRSACPRSCVRRGSPWCRPGRRSPASSARWPSAPRGRRGATARRCWRPRWRSPCAPSFVVPSRPDREGVPHDERPHQAARPRLRGRRARGRRRRPPCCTRPRAPTGVNEAQPGGPTVAAGRVTLTAPAAGSSSATWRGARTATS